MPKKTLLEQAEESPAAATVAEVRKLERQLAAARQEVDGLRSKYRAQEDDLLALEKTVELFTATRGETRSVAARRMPSSKRTGTATAVVVATDWHAEETVDPKTIGGQNAFNLEIAERRVGQLWEKAILLTEASRHLSKIDECVLACLGDLIGGHIHDELLETNALTPIEAVLWVQQRLVEGIGKLLQLGNFRRIRVACLSGNHGRDTKKQRVSTRERHSYEWLAYHNVREHFRDNPRVEFQIADGILNYVDIEGWLVRFTHGDSFKFQGGVGGLTIPAIKRVMRWNETRKAYLTMFGHWHQHLAGQGFIACPTLKGYDAYSEWIGAPKEPPAQLFAVIDRERGLTEQKPIFVE